MGKQFTDLEERSVAWGPIVWKKYMLTEIDFGQPIPEEVWCEGWGPEDQPGICDSYASAIAWNMGLWEEYCEHHRVNR